MKLHYLFIIIYLKYFDPDFLLEKDPRRLTNNEIQYLKLKTINLQQWITSLKDNKTINKEACYNINRQY